MKEFCVSRNWVDKFESKSNWFSDSFVSFQANAFYNVPIEKPLQDSGSYCRSQSYSAIRKNLLIVTQSSAVFQSNNFVTSCGVHCYRDRYLY